MPITGNAQPFNRQQPKKVGPNKQSHTANTKYGMGDNYGTGVKNPLGKMREGMGMQTLTKKKLGTPPKSIA
jgi:hypothetical protein